MENNDKTKWINTVLSCLSELEGSQAKIVLEKCGRECFNSSGNLEKIKKLHDDTEDKYDIDLLFNLYKEKLYQNRPNLQKENGVIYLKYEACACGMVTQGGVTDPFLCNCTIGYTKQIFETLFGRPVRVELIRSVLNGDGICEQKISIPDE